MARALAAALAVWLLAVSGAGGTTAQAPKRGGTIVVGVPAPFEPVCLNGLVRICSSRGNVGSIIQITLVLAGAFDLGPGFATRPYLVSRVDVRKAPFTLTYHIRPEARWSDGTPITARDFQFTVDVVRKSEVFQEIPDDDVFRKIARTTVVDPKTFRVVLASRVPVSEWKLLFRAVIPRHALAGVDLGSIWDDRIDNPKTGKPIASGPFLVERWQRGRELTLVRNVHYWGSETAYVDRLVFRFLPPGELADALRTGRIHVILPGNPLSDEAARGLRTSSSRQVEVRASLSTFWEHLDFRVGPGGHPALESKLVRQALAYGIDRDALVRALQDRVFGRIDPLLRPLESVVFLEQSSYYERNWQRYRYRPAAARRLLEQAGCRRGADGVYGCDGRRLSLRFGSVAGNERRRITLEIVQAQLARVGVEATLQYLPNLPAVIDTFESGGLDAIVFAWSREGRPTPSSVFRCGGSDNFTGHCSRLVTRELVNSDLVVDEDGQARALNRADRMLAEQVPVLPLYQVPFFVALRSTLRNFALHSTEPTWNAEAWWLSDSR